MTPSTLLSRVALALALAAVPLLAGCGNDETTIPTHTTSTTQAPTFVAGDPGAGPSVYLRARSISATALTLEVVGRALPSVYGLAFRLERDPAVLTYASFAKVAPWSATAFAVAQEPTPGLLVAGLSERGAAPGFAATDTVLGVLDFELATVAASSLTFVEAESAVAQADGTELAGVSWIGGAVELP